MDNALHAHEMSAAQRLREVARLLAEGLLRSRLREARKSQVRKEFGEKHLDEGRPERTHGLELSRNGERP
jgi:hypothetical protein